MVKIQCFQLLHFHQINFSQFSSSSSDQPQTATYFSDFAEFGDFSFSFSAKPQSYQLDEQEMARLGIDIDARKNNQISWNFFTDMSKLQNKRHGTISKHTTNQGTVQWLAPEAFDSPSAEQVEVGEYEDPKSISEYSYPVDVYALGLTLWEVLCIQPMDARDLNTSTLRFTRDVPFQLRLLLLACIDQRPQLRPTAKQVVDVLTIHLYMLDYVAMYINNSGMLKL
jgi:serine/threonine protein kinase